jgi:hypothetical protein
LRQVAERKFGDLGLGVGEGLAAGVGEDVGLGDVLLSGEMTCEVDSPPSTLTLAM